MRRLTQGALVGLLLLLGVSLAAAQQAPQPVVRFGNLIEVGNDLFMHLIATADIRYKTAHNLDFERRIRDQAANRNPANTTQPSSTVARTVDPGGIVDQERIWNTL